MTVPMRCSNLSILRVLIPYGHGVVNFLLLFLHALPYATAQTPSPPPPPPDSFSYMGPKFNGTMAIVTVILVSVFFIVGFFSVYIRQCNERRLRRNNPDAFAAIIRGGSLLSRRGARGLDDSVISTFPTFLYSAVKELKIGNGTLECAVCLNEFEDDETLRLIPKCSHVFHMDCIDAWLSAQNTCPVCRANLVPQPDETPLSFDPVLNSDCDSGSGQPEQMSDCNIQEEISQMEQRGDEEAPIVNLTNQNRPPRSRSTGWRLTGWFPRSHSTGHSLAQPGLDCERFTLRLPAEVRSQLMNSSLNRSKSCVAFPRARSSRRGFRSGSGGFVLGRNHNFYERFGRPSRSGNWGLSLTPPFVSRTGSVRTPRSTGDGLAVSCMPSKGLFNSVKSSFEDGRKGERSSDRLRPDNQV